MVTHETEILRYAAAAEAKFAHPIAKAILDGFQSSGNPLPAIDDSRYHVGYGITVGIEGHTVRVGSKRFMEMEGIGFPRSCDEALDEAHHEGNTSSWSASIASWPARSSFRLVRPEVRGIIAGLRERGIKHIAIISGDHDAPTRKLAEELGMDRYFAEVLPADKAEYVQSVPERRPQGLFRGRWHQRLNRAQASQRVDFASRHVFDRNRHRPDRLHAEEGLSKLCDLRDIARSLEQMCGEAGT